MMIYIQLFICFISLVLIIYLIRFTIEFTVHSLLDTLQLRVTSPEQDGTTGMFWLHFCAMGKSRDIMGIFIVALERSLDLNSIIIILNIL